MSHSDVLRRFGNLRGYWPLDGSNQDQSGNGYHLTPTGVNGGPGKFGQAAYFTGGSGSYYSFGTSFVLQSISSFSFWIKFNDFTGASGNFHNLFNKRDAAGDASGAWQVSYYNPSHATYPDSLAFYFHTTGWQGKVTASNIGIKAGIWYHVAISVDISSSGKTVFFLNGKPLGALQVDNTSGTWLTNSSTQTGKIGYSTAATGSFNGGIQEIAVFDRALLHAEVQQYYKFATSRAYVGPLFHVTTGSTTYNQTLTETLTISDSIDRSAVFGSALQESLSLTDQIVTSATRGRQLQETLSITDSIAFDRTRNELLQETLSITDSIAFQQAVRSEKLAESLAILDQIFSNSVLGHSLLETLSINDTIDYTYFSPNPAVLSETLSLADSITYDRPGDFGIVALLGINAALTEVQVNKVLGINVLWPVVYAGAILPVNAPIGSEINFVLSSDNVATIDSSSVYSSSFSIYRTVDKTLSINVVLPTMFDIVKTWSGSSLVISNKLLDIVSFDALGATNKILEMNEVDVLLRGSNVIWGDMMWNQGSGVNRIPTYTILLDGLDVTNAVTECRVSYSVDQFCGEVDVTWANWDLFPNLDCSNLDLNFARERLQVLLEGKSIGKFYLEKRGVSTEFGKTTPTSWGRTAPAKLSLPYALPISKTWDTDTTAMQIAVELAGNVDILWEILDYPIRAGKFTMEEEAPITGIQSLAAVVGGVVTTSRETGALIVRSKWRV